MARTQIRFNVFETNSSSVHSLVLCTKQDYDRWVSGEVVVDFHSRNPIIPVDIEEYEDDKYQDDNFTTYKQWLRMEGETFMRTIKTSAGEEIVAFGYYGYSG